MYEALFNFSNGMTQPGGKTLILDLDETLASTQNDIDLIKLKVYEDFNVFRKFHPIGQRQICYSINITHQGSQMNIWGIKRPGLEVFLPFAQTYFDNVLIWSAGIRPYVEAVCREIFDIEGLNMPRLIWSREDCSVETGVFFKPLSNLPIKLEAAGSPIRINLNQTLILDDRPYTFTANPQNGVLIPPFKPEPNLVQLTDRSDRSLYQFMDWLKTPEVINCSDYRTLDKSKIFN